MTQPQENTQKIKSQP